jgi:hypothetical protein
MLDRRQFLAGTGGLLLAPRAGCGAGELECDIAVIGGGTGGCAAAMAAARSGHRVVMTEETDWVGGQLTSQAVPPDEHIWIEQFGATRSYRSYRDRVRGYYRRNYPLTAEARAVTYLNPGNGNVSRLTHEPRVSLAVLHEMLAPYRSGGKLTVLTRHKPVSADVTGDEVRSVSVQDIDGNRQRAIHAKCFLDATEMGDLLPLSRTEYVTGYESRSQTGEERAPGQAQPANMQAFTVCFAIDHLAGEDHTIDKPAGYQFWRDYRPQLKPAWPGKLFDFTYSHPSTFEPRRLGFDPVADQENTAVSWWNYRRIAARRNFREGAYRSDISLVNWPQNDYLLGNLFEVGAEESQKHLNGGRQLSLSLVYWLQTEAPRPDGGQGWPGIRLRTDITGTADGLARYPYIRESRRIAAEFTVTENHVGTDARVKATGKPREEITAARFDDSVGVGSYRIDLHPSTGGDNYVDVSSLPFQIPAGCLIPRRMNNMLAAAKNVGTTHITNGCYRLHPVEWNIGESAALLAAFALERKTIPRAIRSDRGLLEEFQRRLVEHGIELEWPKVTAR